MKSRRDFLRKVGAFSLGFVAQAGMPLSAWGRPFSGLKDPVIPGTQNDARAGTKDLPLVNARIDINQIGFLPQEPKRAVVAVVGSLASNEFSIVDAGEPHRTRFEGALKSCPLTIHSDAGADGNYFHAEFDAFQSPGRYCLRLPDGRLSQPFDIGRDLYVGLIPLTLRFFTMQNCGIDCHDLHGLCHPDDGVISGGPRDGQTLDASGGWHDAGDYLKFVETASFVTALMLFTCDRFPHLAAPSHNGEPSPLAAQARVGLEWLLRMHPTSDEFYYQVGSEDDHDTWRLPEQDCLANNQKWKPRTIYYGIGANLAGRAAAAFALASRHYAHHDRPFANRCLAAAQSVFKLGISHPAVITTKPYDFYPETTWKDDMAWGAAELYQATHKGEYLNQALAFAHEAQSAGEPISVYNTHALAHYTLHALAPEEDQERLRRYLRDDADLMRQRADNIYGLGVRYTWGTSESAAGAALNCLLYADINENDSQEYLDAARYNRDFILGCNPFGISSLVGAGAHFPHFPHHQIADIKKIELTGALVGGPAPESVFRSQKIKLSQADEPVVMGPPPPDPPGNATIYHDDVGDYVTNEPAIDYTAKFLLLAAFYHSYA